MINKKKSNTRLISFILLPIAILINFIAFYFQADVEFIYSQGIYRFIIKFISSLTGFIPFSLGELTFYGFILIILLNVITLVYKMFKYPNSIKDISIRFFTNIFKYTGFIYLLFILIWSLNYHRLPFSTLSNLETAPSSINDLEQLCENLIDSANRLRMNINQDNKGIMIIQNSYKSVFERSKLGYEKISREYPFLEGDYGRPKPIIASKLLSYTGIAGIYFPFTGEANVNIDIPASSLPSTTCHEIAHQYGFAREDEANFISYLTSVNHPDEDFQYSGTLLALIHSMNALYKYDSEKYLKLKEKYSEGLNRDISEINRYWKSHRGPVEKVSTKMNDMYLKSNLQSDGIHSYGRMVDLLLADFKRK